MRSLALGLDVAVEECFQDPNCSNYLLTGYTRATLEARRMLCIVSFSSTCAEHLRVSVLEDDRFLRKSWLAAWHDG